MLSDRLWNLGLSSKRSAPHPRQDTALRVNQNLSSESRPQAVAPLAALQQLPPSCYGRVRQLCQQECVLRLSPPEHLRSSSLPKLGWAPLHIHFLIVRAPSGTETNMRPLQSILDSEDVPIWSGCHDTNKRHIKMVNRRMHAAGMETTLALQVCKHACA